MDNETKNQMLILKGEIDTTTKSQDEDGVLEAIIASSNVADRDGDIINQDGWELKNFKKNAPLLWAHNIKEVKPPIGKITKIWFEGEGRSKVMKFKTQFDMGDPFAADIFRKIKEGFLNAVSVGFLPLEWERINPEEMFSGIKYLKQELLEISVVPVPANPQALVEIRSKGIEPMEWKDFEKKEVNAPQAKQIKVEPQKKEELDVERLRDALRIVNQATAIALKIIKQKGGESI